MTTIAGAMLLCASSPYARRGALWTAHRKHFGKDGDPVLVWQRKVTVRGSSGIKQRDEVDAAHRIKASSFLIEGEAVNAT